MSLIYFRGIISLILVFYCFYLFIYLFIYCSRESATVVFSPTITNIKRIHSVTAETGENQISFDIIVINFAEEVDKLFNQSNVSFEKIVKVEKNLKLLQLHLTKENCSSIKKRKPKLKKIKLKLNSKNQN